MGSVFGDLWVIIEGLVDMQAKRSITLLMGDDKP
jgi:hypothetical protein